MADAPTWMLTLMVARALKDQCLGVMLLWLPKRLILIQNYFRGGKRGCLVLTGETGVLKTPN